MTRLTKCWPVLFACGTSSCLAAKEYVDDRCAGGLFDQLAVLAGARARLPYEAPPSNPCPALDRPPDGNKNAEGLVFEEYAAVVSGAAGNFIDDGAFWAKALPRGEHHLQTADLYDESCRPLDYDRFRYDYSAATPPIVEVPTCGRALAGAAFGHRFFQASPQVLELEGTAYARLVALRLAPVFGSSFRLVTENATLPDENFPVLTRLALVDHDASSIHFVAALSSRSFEGVLDAVLEPAAATKLEVSLRLFRRDQAPGDVRIGVFAMSSMFWKRDADTPDLVGDEAHDADQLLIGLADGSERVQELHNPAPPGAGDPWERVTFESEIPLTSVALRQTERNTDRYARFDSARYAERPSLTVDHIVSNVALAAELSIAHSASEYIDNVVVNVVATGPAEGPIEVKYILSASSN